MLVLAAFICNDPDTDEATRGKFARFKDTVLDAAVQGGFTQRDIFETLVANFESPERIRPLARQACDMAGDRLRIVRAAMAIAVEEVGI